MCRGVSLLHRDSGPHYPGVKKLRCQPLQVAVTSVVDREAMGQRPNSVRPFHHTDSQLLAKWVRKQLICLISGARDKRSRLPEIPSENPNDGREERDGDQ